MCSFGDHDPENEKDSRTSHDEQFTATQNQEQGSENDRECGRNGIRSAVPDLWNPGSSSSPVLGHECVFLSILIHELGHAVTLRRYGFPSEIVLYAMGGYATSTHLSTWKRVLVSAAGPGAGFILYGLLWGLEYSLVESNSALLQNRAVVYCILLLQWINLFWGLMNLVPCLPLDGGHIMEALVSRYFPRQSHVRVLQISILASGGVAIWALQNIDSRRFLLFMFGYFCATSIIAYNEIKGRR